MNKYRRQGASWKSYYIQDLYSIKNPDKILIESSKSGRLDLGIASLDLGANIHADYDAAVRFASYYGHYEIVKLLIENRANIHVWDDFPVKLASRYGHYDIVKLLIKKGANIHANDDE